MIAVYNTWELLRLCVQFLSFSIFLLSLSHLPFIHPLALRCTPLLFCFSFPFFLLPLPVNEALGSFLSISRQDLRLLRQKHRLKGLKLSHCADHKGIKVCFCCEDGA